MRGVFRGVFEVRASHDGDAYRVYYTLKCPGALYVLHVHKKKSKRGARLPQADRELIVRRYSAALADCSEGGV